MDVLCRWNIFLNGVMNQVSQHIFRLELICYGGNMIRNNDVVKIFKIKYHIKKSVHSKHNEYFNKRTIPLEYLFKWRYAANLASGISFRANKSISKADVLWG